MSDTNEQEDLSKLCLSCGMCCDGSLFTIVEVTKKERKSLRPLGFTVFKNEEGERVFSQPCPRLQDKCCSIYTDRPHPCRSYECLLVLAVKDGEKSLPEALNQVSQLTRTQSELRTTIPISYFLLQGMEMDVPMPDALVGQDDLIPDPAFSFRDFLYDMRQVIKETLAYRALSEEELAWLVKATDYLQGLSTHIHKKKLLKKYRRLMKAATL